MLTRSFSALLPSLAAALLAVGFAQTEETAAHGLFSRARANVVTHAAATTVDCCDACCAVNICYRDRGCRHTCCDPCLEPIKTTLTVCHPCTGCKIEVPVCLPGCCTGDPAVCDRGTLIGAGLTRFDWCCGFSVVVRYQRCGDITVIYRG